MHHSLYKRGSTGSDSSASTPKTHSCTRRSGSRRTKRSRAQALKIGRERIFGAVNNPKIFASANFYPRLHDATPALFDELEQLDDHAFAAAVGLLGPPCNCGLLPGVVNQIDSLVSCSQEQSGIGRTQLRERSMC